MNKKLFITGIGTNIGKTIASAVLVKKLKADYWKPIQAGDLDNTDSHKVQKWTGCKVFKERYSLNSPMSPHAAAKIDNLEIKLTDFELPSTANNLIVEGAGGLMVPINYTGDLIIDLIKHLDLEVVLVSQNYLGSINHTLLSIDALKMRKIPIYGVLFNGVENKETEKYILQYSGAKFLGRLEEINKVDAEGIAKLTENVAL